jgi:hypothetical protein
MPFDVITTRLSDQDSRSPNSSATRERSPWRDAGASDMMVLRLRNPLVQGAHRRSARGRVYNVLDDLRCGSPIGRRAKSCELPEESVRIRPVSSAGDVEAPRGSDVADQLAFAGAA